MNRDDDEDIEKTLVSKAIRPAQLGALDKLVASKLALALVSKPLEKIRHVIEAYMALDEEKKSLLNVSVEEDKEYEKIYTVAVALLNARVYRLRREETVDVWVEHDFAEVSWPFSIEEAPYYFSPWLKTKKDFYFYSEGGESEEIKKYMDILAEKGVGKDSAWVIARAMAILQRPETSTAVNYLHVLNSFIVYAVPKVEQLMSRIFKYAVDPDIWDHVIKLVSGKYEGKEKTGENNFSMG